MGSQAHWIYLSSGARRGYGGAVGLHHKGALLGLITEAWCPPRSFPALIHHSFRSRFHPELIDASVHAALLGLLAFEIRCRVMRLKGWKKIHARNEWFQGYAARTLQKFVRRLPPDGQRPLVHSFSYTAREPFRFARQQGWRTVLDQIDAGKRMQEIELELLRKHAGTGHEITSPPPAYWDSWREELALADRIIVNSEWTRTAMLAQGAEASKIHIIPLSYEAPAEAAAYQRKVPEVFDRSRPLRALFLGQVTQVKGIMPVLEAMDIVGDLPVELHVAGPVRISVPDRFLRHPAVHWRGKVSQNRIGDFYREADVFLFPSFCDGFGITQLEAQAWRVPVISSRCCGDVVADGVNGIRLSEVTAECIASALRDLATNPSRLGQMSKNSGIGSSFTLAAEADACSRLFR